MTSDLRVEDLLTEIRDLLEVTAGALRPDYEVQVVKRLGKRGLKLRELIGSEKRWAATLLMDGTRTQSEVAQQSGLDGSGVSRLVKALSAAGFVQTKDGKPKAEYKPAELEALRNAGG